MSETILKAQDLHKRFDKVHAVQGVSFDIRQGEIFSLLGPNGAGKTTTISMLSCLLTPTKGDAQIDGYSVRTQADKVKQVIGVVPQEISLYPDLSARENLAFWGRMYGMGGAQLKERIEAVLDIVGLSQRAKEKVETYSGGMKRRINIAVGLLHQPKILFMDEPTVGIDPQSRRRILDTVLELNKKGLTVLYTTHYMEEAAELSHRIGIIDHGKLIALGTQEELTRTVGEYDTLHISVDGSKTDPGALVEPIGKIKGVHRASLEDSSFIIQAEDANTVLAGIIAQLDKAGARVLNLRVDEPNLEAVFLHLTGRALRD
ncbi:MAG: ATP-binding cassette domain-containing protein [Chloroflexi bacterium]|nr:ATP-binding cassette domain-containing protein [Chloroflexota bacterium]